MTQPALTHHIPRAQALVAALARSLRLSQRAAIIQRVSRSTHKSFARGTRVKPTTREDYVLALGAALDEAHLLCPLAAPTENPSAAGENAELIARGVGQFAALWDDCVVDALSFGGRSIESPLAVLPHVRLGLEDAGLRIACHARGRPSWLLEADPASVSAALVDGKAFVATLRHLLRSYGLRRATLIEALPVDTLEGWESNGALPSDPSLVAVADCLTTTAAAPLGVHLDLRIAVALCDVWRWLRRTGVPETALRRMARGFVDWTRAMAQWSERTHGSPNEVGWTVLFGARDPYIVRWWTCLSNVMPEPRLAADLEALPGDWKARCRTDNGALADVALAASDTRQWLSEGHPDRDLQDEELLAAKRCIPPVTEWTPSDEPMVAVPTSAELEAHGTRLLHQGRPLEAIPLLELAAVGQPEVAWPRIYLAQALEAVGRLADAEVAVLDAIRIDPSVADAHLVHASVLLGLGRPEEALDTLEGTVEKSEQPWVVRQYQAQAHAQLADWPRVEETAREGLRLNREHACLRSLLAAALDQQGGRDREAIAAAKEAAHRGETMMLDALVAKRTQTG